MYTSILRGDKKTIHPQLSSVAEKKTFRSSSKWTFLISLIRLIKVGPKLLLSALQKVWFKTIRGPRREGPTLKQLKVGLLKKYARKALMHILTLLYWLLCIGEIETQSLLVTRLTLVNYSLAETFVYKQHVNTMDRTGCRKGDCAQQKNPKKHDEKKWRKSEKITKIWKSMVKIKSCHLHLILAKKSPLSQHKWQETETVSPALCKEDMTPPHSRETIFFLLLNDHFKFTHFKLQSKKSCCRTHLAVMILSSLAR